MNQLKAIANKATETDMNVLCNWFNWQKIVEIYPQPPQTEFTIGEWVFNHQHAAISFLKEQFAQLRKQTTMEQRVQEVNWIVDDVVIPASELVPTKTAARSGDVMRVYSAHDGSLSLYSGHDITFDELVKGKQYILTQTGWNNVATQDEYNFILVVRRIFGFTKVRLTNDNLDFIEYGF